MHPGVFMWLTLKVAFFMKTILATAALLTTLSLAPTCLIDDYEMHFTGRSQTVDGVLLYQYECARGHVQWFRAN